MKHSRHKFRNKLFFSLIFISIVPLLICTILIINLTRGQMNRSLKDTGEAELRDIVHDFDEYVKSLENVALEVQRSSNIISAFKEAGYGEETEIYQELFDITGQLRNYAGFSLYDASGNLRYTTGRWAESRLQKDWGLLEKATVAPAHLQMVLVEGKNPELEAATKLVDSGEVLGYLVINTDESGFYELFGRKYGPGNEILVLNRFYRPVYSSQATLADKAPAIRSSLLKNGNIDDDQRFFYFIKKHEVTGICFVLQMPKVFTPSSIRLLYIVSALCALTAIIISVLVAAQLSRQMSKPIYELKQAIGAVGQDNFDVSLNLGSNDEFGRLINRFNEMVKALKTNREQLIENQHELNEAQTRMLQAQLNPHFLCNTLDTMKWIGKINNIPEISIMSTDLAEVLRFAISPEEFVTLEREVDITMRYIEIQKVRLSDSFSFKEEIADDVWDCKVPKMMLQPLVENAILHGISGVENGKIMVLAARDDKGRLVITVRDNGNGIAEELTGPYSKRNQELSRGHLGLHNVDTILRKNYGEEFGIILENLPDHSGAEVTAILPYLTEEEMNV